MQDRIKPTRPLEAPLDPLPEGDRAQVLATLESPEPNDRLAPKPKTRSRTWWGIVSGVAGVVLMGLGLDGSSAELLADGIQVEDIGPVVTTIGAALTAWGLRKAERGVK